MLEKLKYLLILVAIDGTTPLYAQQDSNSICLTNKQFDFYAQALVENKGLKVDTADCAEIVRIYDNIITNIDEQLTNSHDIVTSQGVMMDIKNKDFINLSIDYNKQKKKTKRYQQSTLVFIATTIVLGLIVLVK